MKKFSENTLIWVISGVVLSLVISAVSSIDSTPWKPYVWHYENTCKICIPEDVQLFSLDAAKKLVNNDLLYGKKIKDAGISYNENFCDHAYFKEQELLQEEFDWFTSGEELRYAAKILGSKVCCKNSKVVMSKEDFILWLQKAHQCKPHAPYCKAKIHDVVCDKKFCYRTCTGHCNNVEEPQNAGTSNRIFCRLVPAAYEDGVSEIRLAKNGKELPSARKMTFVLNQLLKGEVSCLRRPNMWALSALELLKLDVSEYINYQPSMHKDNGIRCCNCGNKGPVDNYLSSLACLPIEIPENDKYLAPITCQNFVRTAICPDKNCTIGPINQCNRATSFIDASFLYGSNDHANMVARKKECSTLAIGPHEHLGDTRVKKYPHILLASHCWANLHNIIVSKLKNICTHWNHETTYHVARKVHNVILQNIIYEQLMKFVLSSYWLKKHDLLIIPNKDKNCYDSVIKPCTFNEFALIIELINSVWIPRKINVGKDKIQSYDLNQLLWIDEFTYSKKRDLIAGMMSQPIDSTVLSTNLVNDAHNCKKDKYAEILMRSRDHGLGSYVDYVYVCHNKKITCWEDFHTLIKPEKVAILKTQYKHYSDVEILPGCAAETLTNDDLLPPTMQCVIAYQMRILKAGDKHFYTNKGALTKEQFEEISKFTMRDLLCSCGASKVSKNPFAVTDHEKNPLKSCDDCVDLDLSCFANEPIVEEHK